MPKWDVTFDLGIGLREPGLLQAVSRAEALAEVIRGVPIPPHLRTRFDRLNILRAVRGTTGIEGCDLTEEEVGRVLDATGGEAILTRAREREEREVRNAGRVLEFVASTLDKNPSQPVTEELICTLHRLTTEGIAYGSNVPGQYRVHGVTAGTYSPPGGDEVPRLMKEFVQWLNGGAARWPPIVRAIGAHFYLISIHPFGDGNGRTARAVESILLYQARVNACGFYSLANFYYRRRAEYIAMLDHVRFRSGDDLTPFVLLAARGLVEELESVHREILAEVTLIAFRDFARETLQTHGKLGTKAGERMFHFLLGLTRDSVGSRL